MKKHTTTKKTPRRWDWKDIENLATHAVFSGNADQQLALVTLLDVIARAAGFTPDEVESYAITARNAAFRNCDCLIDQAIDLTVTNSFLPEKEGSHAAN